MSGDVLLTYLPQWGPWLVGLTTFLSCLLLPVPSSLMMLAAGALSITGEFSLLLTGLAALLGAVAGDSIGYMLSEKLLARIARQPKVEPLMQRAHEVLTRRGPVALFLSRWLFSPLGPWVNLAAGMTRYGYGRFLPPVMAGEAVWVTIYLGLGRAFGASYDMVADVMGSVMGLLAAVAVLVLLGRQLWKRRHRISI